MEKRKMQRSAETGRNNTSRKKRAVLAKAAAAITAGLLTFSGSTELFNSYTPMSLVFIH